MRRAEAYRPPPALTLDQIRKVLAPFGFAPPATITSVKVTPASPIAGKFLLYFVDVANMHPTINAAEIHGASGAVYFQFSAGTGQRHMIDCTVEPATPGYRIVGPGGFLQTFDNTTHLIIVHEATSIVATAFRIERAFSNSDWTFYSCELTRID